MSFILHIYCISSALGEQLGHRDISFTSHPTWKDVCDSDIRYGYHMINDISSNDSNYVSPQLDDKVILNIVYTMRFNGCVCWSFMLVTI